ncbi:MAG: rRNA (cytidine1920-2-O)/16S rRNA (cytidine1409-2-O)-methyltransferase [Candidatus Eremiobacteraeota bacterium]|jgi:23S rRNA (cytidine1920-2'-O)/16S rRNA (cytidine1409-2'-O)-methyltransferase|nr:rRNA (cytidine1920-2-O)/16S rRNA (cytidine1409-2-O)-methyltransferase [Candidatus Eremiobacteraeota bacterium]
MTTRSRSEGAARALARREQRRLDAMVADLMHSTRSQARALILAGKVRVDDAPSTKPGANVRDGARVVIEASPRYVSRGGDKLAGALHAFGMDVTGLDALDVGASTGGFTDALLQHGARRVTALDVGYGQLAWKLRGDPRVTVIERTNFRTLRDDAFPDGFDLIVVDASFISLRTIVARAVAYLRAHGAIVALVKPQFEAGRERIGGGGVVRDPAVHAAILREVRDAVRASGVRAVRAAASPLRGPAGNAEFFYELRRDGDEVDDARLDALVAEVHAP